MKVTKFTLVAITTVAISACSSSKKAATTSVTTTTAPFIVAGSADGIYPPGNEELIAIQVKHKDVTLEKLREGYKIYTQGACVNCHTPQNIYAHSEDQWEGIVDDMSQKANIPDDQKEAVYKYVLAIKATQAK